MNKHVATSHDALDLLCPLHVKLDETGTIVHAGPTLRKLRSNGVLNRPLWDVFHIQRPRNLYSLDDLHSMGGRKIHMLFNSSPATPFKGVCARGPLFTLINLSFGIGLIEAVQTYGLTNGDFAATDLAIEMLYLSEAKNIALRESSALNRNLETARQNAIAQANSDVLTGLANRRAMTEQLERLIANQQDFACMHLDLDYFKAVNDTYGHAAGDHILKEVAKILNAETRKDDCVARVGGDEFVILFVGLTDRNQLDKIAKRIIAKLEIPVHYQGHICRISGSAGTSLSSFYSSPDADGLLSDADIALYASKDAGRGCHNFYSVAMQA